jgi:hypothetical protein
MNDQSESPERDASLPGSDLPRTVQPLPFFWWLNPWKHMELLFDAYTDHADIANKWRKLYHMHERLWTSDYNERDKRAEERRQDIKRLQDELHKANYTIKTLKKKLRTK